MKTLTAQALFITSWAELDAVDAWRALTYKGNMATALEARLHIQYGYNLKALLHLLSTDKHTIKKLSAAQLVDIYNDPAMFWHKPFTCFYLPKLSTSSFTLYAPLEDLESTTFSHFKYIDAAFTAYLLAAHHHRQLEAAGLLNKFIATLYTPLSGFNATRVAAIQKEINLLQYQQSLIITAYANIRTNIINRCTFLFPKPHNPQTGSQTKKAPPTPVFTGPMWHNLHYDLAETEAFKGFEASGQSNVYDVLDYLDKKAKENKTRK